MGISNLSFSATNIQTGLYADIPPTPRAGDEYNATDVGNKYVCFSDGIWSKLDVGESVRLNVALNAFDISILNTWSIHNMLDGVRDVFNDAAGILSGGSVAGGVLTLSRFAPNTATASSISSAEYPATDAINDTVVTSDDCWISGLDGAIGEYLTIDYGVGNTPIFNKFEYHTRAPDDGTYNYMSGFKLQGSNDNSIWDDLKTVTSQTMAADTSYTYTFSNTTGYRYYRVLETARDITPNNIYNQCCIGFCFFSRVPGITISNSVTAETQPTNIHAVILADDAAITLNTNLKISVSVDDGATWEQITIEDSGDYNATSKILTGSVVVTGTGTDVKYKIECTQADYEIYAVGLLWD